MKKSTHSVSTAIAAILLIIGLGLVMYPIALNLVFDRQARDTMAEFDRTAKSLRSGNDDALRQAMIAYNENLYVTGQSGLIDQLSYEVPDFRLQDYGVMSDVLGRVAIPSIGIDLPIYNGASVENLAKGAAYLAYTSLPVPGNNTNCVIAGHTVDNGVAMFKRIVELEPGDTIEVENFWETLVFEVVETKIVYPSESQDIYIQPGRSLLTLSTCYPYPENYQRYLVIAEYRSSV